ncbi:class I SAM-dependent DNA methyltransferase [Hydrogenimonas sp.]
MNFDHRAKTWDASDRRQALAQAVTNAIEESFPLDPSMHLLDIGAGTGLVMRRLLPKVGKISAVDTSIGMLEELKKSLEGTHHSYTLHHGNIMHFESRERFDGIVSSMTLHHIRDISGLFEHLFTLLKPGGFLAFADLAPEDGTFHDHGNDGVHHFGFEEEPLKRIVEHTGFEKVRYRIIHSIDKKEKGLYDVFLLTATTPPTR